MSARVVQAYGDIPLSFEENLGQTDARVKYFSRGNRYVLFLTQTEAVLSLNETSGDKALNKTPTENEPQLGARKRRGTGQPKRAVLRMRFAGTNPQAKIQPEGVREGKVNYFIGNDPAKWRTDVPVCGGVRYGGIYDGIDLVYHGNEHQLEYDLVIAPEADARTPQMVFEGNRGLRIGQSEELVVTLSGGKEVRLKRPLAYQEGEAGEKKLIEARYEIKGRHRLGFEVGGYDGSKALIIDPIVVYSTYLGGSTQDFGRGVAVDTSGNAYVAGYSSSVDFPLANPIRSQKGIFNNAFVSKLNAAGNALVYSTYLGGSLDDTGSAIAVDASGNAYIAGYTRSTDFPLVNPIQAQLHGSPSFDQGDAFITKISSAGNALVYSSYLGGSEKDEASCVAVDGFGNAYVAGRTESRDFPTVNAIQRKLRGGSDSFVAKVDPSGGSLVYSTYLGGTNADPFEQASGIAADSSGNAYVVGSTTATDFPTVNPIQAKNGGLSDAFVSKIDPTGSALVYSTYLGGPGYDYGSAIAVDSSGNAYVAGLLGQVYKINAPGTALVYSTTSPGSTCRGIAVDASGNAYVVGAGSGDAFVAKINPPGTARVYTTYLGGSAEDQGMAVAVDLSGNVYVVGDTSSSDFPTTIPIQSQKRGGTNAFIAKLADASSDTADVAIAQQGSFKSAISGSGFSYTITVSNNGPDVARDVVVNTSTPLGTTFAFLATSKGTSTSPGSGNTGAIACFIGTMNPRENIEIKLSLNVVAPAGATITSTASVTTSTPDVNLENNSATTATPVIAPTNEADLRIVDIVSGGLFVRNNAGAPYFYTVKIGNDGPAAATDVLVTVTTPVNMTFERAIASAGVLTTPAIGGVGDVVCSLALLPAGESLSITVAAKVKSDMNSVSFSARVSSSSPDPDLSNNQRNGGGGFGQGDQVPPPPSVTVPAIAATGTRLRYTIALDFKDAVLDLFVFLPVDTTFAALYINGMPTRVTTPAVGGVGAIMITTSYSLTATLDVNVLAGPGSVLEPLIGLSGVPNSVVKPSTQIAGGSIVNLLWQQPGAPGDPTVAIASPPLNLQVKPVSLLFDDARDPRVSAMDMSSCMLVKVNIYKADQPCVQTIPSNLWKSVPPEQVQAEMSAAPAGSYYVLTNVWSCGGTLFESGASNECSSTGMCANCTSGSASPQITNVEKSGKDLVITGTGFVDGSKILVEGEAQNTIYESATQLTGKKLGKTTSRGAKIQVRNPDGSVSNEWVY